ncbi:MAG: hypothetical protein IPK14_22325 [Blastocatellia bacterium]|nr:hypothetical protein [Blastocatellia bacterium]
MIKTDNKVVAISENQINDAVNTLTLAFEKDPFHRYVFENHLKHYRTLEQILFKYLTVVKFKHSQNILGVTRDNKLMGIANIESPEYKESFWKSYISPDVSSLLLQMILVSGLVPTYRLIKYSQLIGAKSQKNLIFI